jgi:hypothetical protein
MLTKKEIESLPAGYFPNTVLRRTFGKKHGSVFKERFTMKNEKGEDETMDFNIIGNRFQRRYRLKNPLTPLPVRHKPVEYFPSKAESKDKRRSFLERTVDGVKVFFSKVFSRKKKV